MLARLYRVRTLTALFASDKVEKRLREKYA